MYGYNEYVPLELEEVLKRATEEEIFRIVIQEDIIVDEGARYLAPYRNDTHPDCWFDKYDGRLWFVDFAKGVGKPGMSCFDLIAKTYNVSFKQTLEIINDKLNLGLGDNLGKAKKIIHEHGIIEEKNVKKVFKERIITYLPRPFNYKDKQFWSKYEITRKNLEEDGVISVELYKSTNKRGEPFSHRPFGLCYAYTKFVDLEGNITEGKVKIYMPNAPKEGKWFTNCNQNNIGGLEYIDYNNETLIITKSYKDFRVLKNQGLNVIWFQNEGQIPSKSLLLAICKRFKRIVVWFDNDSTGITSSRIVKDYINEICGDKIAHTLTLPPRLISSDITDPSDYFEKMGKDSLLEFLKQKYLL